MSLNICKECGKQFEAKSPRILYCSDIHYRPCPVCGKPVEAKYLSDPARRCEDCKGKGKISPKARVQAASKIALGFASEPLSEANSDNPDYINGPGTYTRKYVGSNACGFVTNHVYTIIVNPFNLYGYDIVAVFDHTEDSEMHKMISAASRISINHMFVAQ